MADMGWLAARTDPDAPKHKGITMFMLDMKSPGVTVRPLVNMANTPGFNEVFFDNVRVPAKDLLGEENRGWYVGTTTLDFERSSIGTSVAQTNAVEDLVLFIKQRGGDVHPTIKLELAERAIEAETARLLSYRVITLQNRGMVPNHEASAIKLYAGELGQRVANTGIKVAGLYGMLDGKGKLGPDHAANRYAANRGKFVRSYLNAVAGTIAGGTSEVQRNIIAGRGLGLPRD
jgi:alkylation response protein AidB-like acyl-CoA dehydrogenase